MEQWRQIRYSRERDAKRERNVNNKRNICVYSSRWMTASTVHSQHIFINKVKKTFISYFYYISIIHFHLSFDDVLIFFFSFCLHYFFCSFAHSRQTFDTFSVDVTQCCITSFTEPMNLYYYFFLCVLIFIWAKHFLRH